MTMNHGGCTVVDSSQRLNQNGHTQNLCINSHVVFLKKKCIKNLIKRFLPESHCGDSWASIVFCWGLLFYRTKAGLSLMSIEFT